MRIVSRYMEVSNRELARREGISIVILPESVVRMEGVISSRRRWRRPGCLRASKRIQPAQGIALEFILELVSRDY